LTVLLKGVRGRPSLATLAALVPSKTLGAAKECPADPVTLNTFERFLMSMHHVFETGGSIHLHWARSITNATQVAKPTCFVLLCFVLRLLPSHNMELQPISLLYEIICGT
jgi:hypothetical protein